MEKVKRYKLKKILLAIGLTIVLFIFSLLAFITITYIATPLNKSKLAYTNLGIEIYDTTTSSTPIYYSGDKKIISTSYLQPHTLNAFIAIEDKRFYDHNGYDLKRIIKAGIVNLKEGNKSQGASTITQQLVKNILLNSEKTYSRKFKEIILAIKTEKNFNKNEILNMYLNSIYFGSNAYGIENASNLYFNKSASELDINQSACLAGIIKSPSYYSPINHPDTCFKRKNLVLQQMYNNGFITKQEYDENVNKPIEVSSSKNTYDNSYNQQVILEACDLLNISEKELLRQELKVYTYLDNDIQQQLQKSLYSSSFKGDKLSIVTDNNGKVLAYLGDSYYDLSKMRRNPASTIKPLIIYLPAIALNKVSPLTPILDERLDENYSPKNAGDKYDGWTTIRNALSNSSNVCAVKILNEIGLDAVNEYGEKLNLFHVRQNNPSIALGDIGGGITPLTLARAYSVLQNNGIDKGITFIDKIADKNGKIIYQNTGYNHRLFNEEDCMLVNDMLVTCAKSGTAKRLSDLPFDVASKTGTAQNNEKNTDLWNIAYTPNHLCLTWCGDATSKGLENNASSGFYPTMINKDILSNIYSSQAPKKFELNNKIVKVAIDSIEYETNHTLTLAPDDSIERYVVYDLFKVDNIPSSISPTYQEPCFDLKVDLTTSGTKISLNLNPIFEYEIYALADNKIRLIGQYTDILYDDKVFTCNNIQYYAVAKNKYTNKQFVSNKIVLSPQEYLIERLNQNYVSRNRQTKTRWYV